MSSEGCVKAVQSNVKEKKKKPRPPPVKVKSEVKEVKVKVKINLELHIVLPDSKGGFDDFSPTTPRTDEETSLCDLGDDTTLSVTGHKGASNELITTRFDFLCCLCCPYGQCGLPFDGVRISVEGKNPDGTSTGIEMRDAHDYPLEHEIPALNDLIERLIIMTKGKKVLLCCQNGSNRSCSVMVALIIKKGMFPEAKTIEELLMMAYEIRPHTHPKEGLRNYLKLLLEERLKNSSDIA